MICREYNIDFEFRDNCIVEFLIESPEILQNFICGLLRQNDGGKDFIIFSENNKEVALNKASSIIIDPFHVEINNRKLLAKIHQDLIRDYQDSDMESILRLQNLIECFLLDVCEHSEYEMTYDNNIDMVDLLKLYNVRFDSNENDFACNLISYIKLAHRVLGHSVFVFINLKTFFSQNVIRDFYQTICYENIYIVLIERYDLYTTEREKRIIIDKDSCLIYDK